MFFCTFLLKFLLSTTLLDFHKHRKATQWERGSLRWRIKSSRWKLFAFNFIRYFISHSLLLHSKLLLKSIVFVESSLTYLSRKLFVRYRCRLSFFFLFPHPFHTILAKNIFHNSTFIIIVKSEKNRAKIFLAFLFFVDQTLTFFCSFLFVIFLVCFSAENVLPCFSETSFVGGKFSSCSLIFPIYILRTFLRSHKPRVDPLFVIIRIVISAIPIQSSGIIVSLLHTMGYPIKIKASTSICLS